MELKQKWRHFWTLNRHHEDGFTLVELVVVIAILAILAAVTVPAYDDYITKAKESADEQIVAAVNTAFAAACVENKVDVANVTEAAISVIDNRVHSLSSVTATETETSVAVDSENFNKIYEGFSYYYEGNEGAVFKNGIVNSLQWNSSKGGFEISASYVDTRVTLSNGKVITVSAEDMEMIQKSAFANMGYSGVAEAIGNVSSSGATLAKVAGGLGMMSRLTDVMLANGLISEEKASEMQSALSIWNYGKESYNTATTEASNALQMVTAKYLANGGDVNELLGIKLENSTSMLTSMVDGNGGTKTVSAAALQYALAESFANSNASESTTISYTVNEGSIFRPNNVTYTVSVSEFLASDYAQDDPVKALAMVQATDGYKAYASPTNEQYQNDINGFVGTMSILGDNVGAVNKDGSIKKDGAIDPDNYLSSGINGNDAKDVLTEILGE